MYKRELRLRQEMLRNAETNRYQQNIQNALGKMVGALGTDDTDEWVNKLNQKSGLAEAKLELANQPIEDEAPIKPLAESNASANHELTALERLMALESVSDESLVTSAVESPAEVLARVKRSLGLDNPTETDLQALPSEEADSPNTPKRSLGD
jgi:hypothetical protein